MTEFIETTPQMNDDNKTTRIEVNIHDSVRIEKLLKNIGLSNGVYNESYKDVQQIGWVYTVILENEFGSDFDNEIKFETDFKSEAEKHSNLTHQIFKKGEIERLNLIDETIKKCSINGAFYRQFEQYIGMCSYLEFLENYKPEANLKQKISQNESDTKIIKSFGIYLDDLPITISNSLSELDPEKPHNPFFMGFETKEGNFFCQNWDNLLFLEKYDTHEKLLEIQQLIEMYAKGFNYGYNSFISTIKNQVTEIFSTNDESSSRAIYIRTKGKRGSINECFYKNITNERCYEFGKLAGEYYKAWEVIVKNPSLFENFFLDVSDKSEFYLETDYNLNIQTDYGKLQYNQGILSQLHGKFNDDGKLWKPIDINIFYDNFKEKPAKTLKILNEIGFSYLIRKYDNEIISNEEIEKVIIKDWFKSHFDIANTSKHKDRSTYEYRKSQKELVGSKFTRRTKEDDLIDYINNKLK